MEDKNFREFRRRISEKLYKVKPPALCINTEHGNAEARFHVSYGRNFLCINGTFVNLYLCEDDDQPTDQAIFEHRRTVLAGGVSVLLRKKHEELFENLVDCLTEYDPVNAAFNRAIFEREWQEAIKKRNDNQIAER